MTKDAARILLTLIILVGGFFVAAKKIFYCSDFKSSGVSGVAEAKNCDSSESGITESKMRKSQGPSHEIRRKIPGKIKPVSIDNKLKICVDINKKDLRKFLGRVYISASPVRHRYAEMKSTQRAIKGDKKNRARIYPCNSNGVAVVFAQDFLERPNSVTAGVKLIIKAVLKCPNNKSLQSENKNFFVTPSGGFQQIFDDGGRAFKSVLKITLYDSFFVEIVVKDENGAPQPQVPVGLFSCYSDPLRTDIFQ